MFTFVPKGFHFTSCKYYYLLQITLSAPIPMGQQNYLSSCFLFLYTTIADLGRSLSFPKMDIGEVRVLFGWAINYVLGSISGVNIVSCISSGRALAATQGHKGEAKPEQHCPQCAMTRLQLFFWPKLFFKNSLIYRWLNKYRPPCEPVVCVSCDISNRAERSCTCSPTWVKSKC